ncbi:FUN14 domain-containing protein 2 isoform X2 [Pangasianodon hypophthalmus]|uniref:FUN14 domain-containing protein 2 isoform X2 n=1 Tax=Pangasianodon hypophthalmus TaxID=310915 RepID=UPI00147EF63E|nr:FUN14 domain-containing protein 2 isoform X2 [Pangasianodon hypophthalmus]
MAGKKKDAETFDVIELAEHVKKQRWWNKMFGDNSGPAAEKYSVATQLAIGGVTGWCAGYLFRKVGKVAASAVGGGFFLLQEENKENGNSFNSKFRLRISAPQLRVQQVTSNQNGRSQHQQ